MAWRARVVLDLRAQTTDVNRQCAAVDITRLVVPQSRKDLLWRKHDVGVFHEKHQQLVFARRERDRFSIFRDGTTQKIHRDPA